MKKWTSRVFAIALALILLLSLMPQRAEAAGVSLSGAGSLRPGDSVTLTFSAGGSNIYATWRADYAYIDFSRLNAVG